MNSLIAIVGLPEETQQTRNENVFNFLIENFFLAACRMAVDTVGDTKRHKPKMNGD